MEHGYERRRVARNKANELSASDVQDAEWVFYKAMTRHGRNSAEALVAGHIWKELRKRVANQTSREQITAT